MHLPRSAFGPPAPQKALSPSLFFLENKPSRWGRRGAPPIVGGGGRWGRRGRGGGARGGNDGEWGGGGVRFSSGGSSGDGNGSGSSSSNIEPGGIGAIGSPAAEGGRRE